MIAVTMTQFALGALSHFHNGRSKLNEAPKKMPPLVQWGQKAER